MSDSHAKTPIWFWILAVIAILWNGYGVFAYIATQYQWAPALEGLTEEQLTYFYSMPAWSTGLWAVSVMVAFVASIFLILRKGPADIMFLLGMIGFLITNIYSLFVRGGIAIMGTPALIVAVVIFLSLLGFFWTARWASSAGIMK
ncbi:MAG: hypothetical protein DHS20C06_03340 [Hyphobacterium sp.]|nr:MAG: hypothetical protein DHS20C06_03340 [Hyphobacterium sp.]